MPNNIELRSDEVKEILGQVPSWIIRNGILVFISILALLVSGTWFFTYPDIIIGEIELTSINPPANILANTSAKFQQIKALDRQKVNRGDVLAILKSSANTQDMLQLQEQIGEWTSLVLLHKFDSIKTNSVFSLGDVQERYSAFVRSLSNIRNYQKQAYFKHKIDAKRGQQKKYRIYYKRLCTQGNLLENQLSINRKEFCRDSLLFTKGIYSLADYQKSQKILIQSSFSFQQSLSTLSQADIQISQLEQEILNLQLQQEQEFHDLTSKLIANVETLNANINMWIQQYVILAPISGTLNYQNYWNKNQNIKQGDCVFTIIPNDSTRIIARAHIPVQGAGKVKIGQRVNIKLQNYPYLEYGILNAEITSISRVPENNKYSLQLRLKNGLRTNYGIELPFAQQSTGTAEIITANLRLLQRIFNPLRAIFKEQSDFNKHKNN